ncbi:MAG: APC family permease [Anaerolineaceae bacterium]|nr:APC family permease [Anaerolineaceae bacterium]
MNIGDSSGTTIQRKTIEYQPRRSWRSWLIGRPLSTADAPHQTIGKLVGLAVFSSDALSSVAYGPQEVLTILIVAGSAALKYSIPITFAIIGLLAILTLSYEQTIHAYPGGGGAYIVARDNIGEIPALVAAAALLTDYILTVAVSISSGVAQLVSAAPSLFPYRVSLAVAMVLFIMVINLRGVRESGLTFAIPSYYFLVMMYITVGVGLFRYLAGTLGVVAEPPSIGQVQILQPIGIFLILRAFASGTSALTGVEAISNGIPAFKEPRSKNAGITLLWMSLILGSLLLGISFLSHQIGALPSEDETVISQLTRTVFEQRGALYLAAISSTTIILMLAANTAYADFPRLSAIAAIDGFLPRQLAYRGSRLVYSRGIIALGLIASALIILFQASVNQLIPLYAIGVFVSFTLSQSGMAHRWWKVGHLKPGQEIRERGSTLRRETKWELKMVINGFGSLCAALVAVIFATTKFLQGAWIVVILIPLMVVVFASIHRHYVGLAGLLSLDNYGALPRVTRHRVIMTISGVHRGTLAALGFARTISDDITAVHVSIDPEETARIQKKWAVWGEGYRLVILESPYRLFLEPLLQYIEEIDAQRQPNEAIIIVVPQFVPKHWWSNMLHTRTADTLRKVLISHKSLVITEVPYQVD